MSGRGRRKLAWETGNRVPRVGVSPCTRIGLIGSGKIVVDTNNYYPERDGRIAVLDDASTTSSELLAGHLPQSRIVKAFNTIYFMHLGEDGLPVGDAARRALPIAGDDATAKATVSALIDSFGFDVVDAGPLAAGRAFQPDTAVYNVRQTRAELAAGLGA